MWLLQKAEKRAFQERKECVSSELILKEDKVKKKRLPWTQQLSDSEEGGFTKDDLAKARWQ